VPHVGHMEYLLRNQRRRGEMKVVNVLSCEGALSPAPNVRGGGLSISSLRHYKIVSLLLALVFAFASVSSSRGDTMDEGDRLQFADGLFARGMHELALKEYESFLRDFPSTAKADAVHFKMGECYRGLGKVADAEKEFLGVFTGYTNSEFRLKAGFRQAVLVTESGQDESAIGLFQALLNEKLPDDIAAASCYHLGELFEKTGKNEDATKAFEQTKNLYPSSTLYSYALLKVGATYARDKAREDQALEMYRLAAEKPATSRIGAEALFQAAEIYFSRKTFDKSAEAYKKLLTQYPADQRAIESRLQGAWACHNAGLYVDAMNIAGGALKGELGDKKPEWLYLKANCERQLMKNESAVETYSQLLEQHPTSSLVNVARYEKALTCYKMGKFKDAVEEAGKVTQTPEFKKDVCWLLAESHAALKEEDLAIQYYRIITAEFPKSDVACDAAYRLAHHLQGKKEFKEASRCYNIVAVNFPENKLAPMALFASAFCGASDGRHEDALRDWATLIQKYPSDALVEESFYHKAVTEIGLKRFSEGMTSLRELLKKFPASKFAADAHYWLGVTLEQEKKPQDAEPELQVAVKDGAGKDWLKEAEFRLATVLQKNGKNDEAAVLFQSLLTSPLRDNFSPQLLEWLSEYRFDKKEYRESVDAAQLMVERNKNAEWQQIGWCLIGRGQIAQGDKASAGLSYRKAVALDAKTPLLAESALRLGELTMGGTNQADAAKFFAQAASLASDEKLLGVRARAYVGLGRAAKAVSDSEGAARYFMSVAVLYDDAEIVPECLFEAAEAYKKLGKQDEAAKTIKELKERYPQSDWAKKGQ